MIETPRLVLRELVPGDLDFVATMLAHPEVNRYYEKRFTRADAEVWLTRQLERYRRDGRRLVAALVAHLDADAADAAERTRSELEATALVDDLARRLAASGTSLTESVGLFVAARRPFLDELTGLGRRRALDAARLAALYERASGLLDRLLLRLISTFQQAIAST